VRPSSRALGLFFTLALVALPAAARADAPNGPEFVRLLGPRATQVLAPVSGRIGALVTLAPGEDAASLGVEPFVPGFARLHGSPADILAFADTHPGVHLEVAPPVHALLDYVQFVVESGIGRASFPVEGGEGVLVGVADTGLDVTHPDLRDPVTKKSRVAWLLDLSLPPQGLYPDLESTYGVRGADGNLMLGAVFQGSDIDARIAKGGSLPHDEVGHGTHVTSIAAGNGGAAARYVGIAPNASIVFARIGRDSTGSFETDDLVDGVKFLFDRADAMKLPVAVNLSLGTDFGPHDGTMSWEQTLASFVGSANPGHVITVAAGNSGSIVFQPGQPLIHNSVFVDPGSTTRVPITTVGASNGTIEVWVATHPGASVSVGLDGPDGTWISPASGGQSKGKDGSGYTAGVVNGSSASGSQVPMGSYGAIVEWSGSFPAGVYQITLEGHGMAELYMESAGDASGDGTVNVGFVDGVREGTINLPATSPSLIGVGCTVNKTQWTSIDYTTVGIDFPLLDGPGGLPASGTPLDPSPSRPLRLGEICFFSSAGPTVTGVPKPEISSPGGIVVAAMSHQALPGVLTSVFTNPGCPPPTGSTEPDMRCLEIDPTHAVLSGTSMSAPQAAGAAALLLKRDPTLTQGQVVALLQAGVHDFRSPPLFEDQGGAGELDVLGALDALEQLNDETQYLPGSCDANGDCPSWLTLSADHAPADASTQVVAIVELRTADAKGRADLFDPSRLAPVILVGTATLTPLPPMIRKAPGLWFFTVPLPPGLGGSSLTVGATFDGVDIVPRRTIPIATDVWTGSYPTTAGGSCGLSPSRPAGGSAVALALALALALARRRREEGQGQGQGQGQGLSR
jgi:subtilisin family serine protease